jgi:hypothetical protein
MAERVGAVENSTGFSTAFEGGVLAVLSAVSVHAPATGNSGRTPTKVHHLTGHYL